MNRIAALHGEFRRSILNVRNSFSGFPDVMIKTDLSKADFSGGNA